ncbi:putative mitochondrial protein [Vitis vinifera]|uniref:Putative mitochondrial protein n=1 Tax=Vitis vinifera TaxID=29760 RepID=A0A438IHA7_VITVI|nr:putative mitochondrial protein [Vitis vinifera]
MVGAHNHLSIDHSASFVASLATPWFAATIVQAMMASPSTISDEAWFFDTGAAHHLSQSVDPLSDVQPYMGNDKFCADNNTFFEFHPRFFFVKDQVTKKILLQGSLEHGLYRFPTRFVHSPATFVSSSYDRHVVFHETVFPFQSTPDQSSYVVTVPTPALLPCSSSPMSSLPSHTTSSTSSLPLTNMPSSTTSLPDLIQVPFADISTSEPHPTNQHPMVTRAKNGINKKKAYFSSHISKPTTFTHAVKDSNWVLAMEKEFSTLQRNNTWHLVPPASNGNIIGCKWVYKLKYKLDGIVDRYKARPLGHGIPNSALHFLARDFKLLKLTA